jgi:hypothetical protein
VEGSSVGLFVEIASFLTVRWRERREMEEKERERVDGWGQDKAIGLKI